MTDFTLVNGDSIPSEICKYFSITTTFYNSIIENYLWFSDPLEFNDPYDCNLSNSIDNSEDETREYFKHVLATRPDMQAKCSNEFYEERVKMFLNYPEKALKEINQVFRENIIPGYGICCFSLFCDSLLMWSHYADKHNGVCLVFEKIGRAHV